MEINIICCIRVSGCWQFDFKFLNRNLGILPAATAEEEALQTDMPLEQHLEPGSQRQEAVRSYLSYRPLEPREGEPRQPNNKAC